MYGIKWIFSVKIHGMNYEVHFFTIALSLYYLADGLFPNLYTILMLSPFQTCIPLISNGQVTVDLDL